MQMIVWVAFLSSCSLLQYVTSEIDGLDDPDQLETYMHNILWYDTTSVIPAKDYSTTEAPKLPFFEDEIEGSSNFTVQYGVNVSLDCKVHDLLDKTVSWMKRHGEKLDLLTWGPQVYSKDERYEIGFLQPNNWQLKIRFVNQRDEGHYECQISAHPPLVKHVFLLVVVPEMEIADERGVSIKNKYYNSGSTIELKCTISKIPQPAHFIIWKHGTRILNYDTIRGGISVKTDMLHNGAKSRLFIANATPADSGNYTCSLSANAATVVSVHVLNGETPAAMQHGGSSSSYHVMFCLYQLALYWFLFYMR